MRCARPSRRSARRDRGRPATAPRPGRRRHRRHAAADALRCRRALRRNSPASRATRIGRAGGPARRARAARARAGRGAGLVDTEAAIVAVERHRFAQRQAGPRRRRARRSAARQGRAIASSAFDEQRAVEQRGLALPERGERFELVRAGGHVARRDRMQLQAAVRGDRRRDVALAVRIVAPAAAARAAWRRLVRARATIALGRCALRLGHRARRRGTARSSGRSRASSTLMPARKCSTRSSMRSRRGDQRHVVLELDQAPAAQRPGRRERAPVRLGAVRPARGRSLPTAAAARLAALAHSAASSASISTPAHSSSRSRSKALRPKRRASWSIAAGAGHCGAGSVRRRVRAASSSPASREPLLQPRELRHQQPLVGLGPVRSTRSGAFM